MVSTGRVTEFRAAAGNAPQLWKVPLPSLAVAYRRRRNENAWDYRLMLLENVRLEALGTISDEGLRRAGYEGDDAFARFRRDWMISEKKRFQPLRRVHVYTVRPVQEGDFTLAGMALVKHLYEDFADAQERARAIVLRRRAALA
jgi:hypothetical protein